MRLPYKGIPVSPPKNEGTLCVQIYKNVQIVSEEKARCTTMCIIYLYVKYYFLVYAYKCIDYLRKNT